MWGCHFSLLSLEIMQKQQEEIKEKRKKEGRKKGRKERGPVKEEGAIATSCRILHWGAKPSDLPMKKQIYSLQRKSNKLNIL